MNQPGTSSPRAARRRAWLKAGAWGLLVLAVAVLSWRYGGPEIAAIGDRVDAAGAWGPVVFLGFFVVACLLPTPKNLLTVAGGAMFGMIPGAALALTGAVIGAVLSFTGSRVLGRSAVEEIRSPRRERIDERLREHGFVTVLMLRLAPVLPYTAINYAAGLSGVRFHSFALASALGMIPGALAYAAFGAYGRADPMRTTIAASGVALLLVGGWLLARRLAGPRDDDNATAGPTSETVALP